MTLVDLGRIIKRNLLLVIGLPIVCAIVCAAVIFLMPPSYEAKATLTPNIELVNIGNMGTKAAENHSVNGVTVKAETNSSSKSITFTAKGKNPEMVLREVNAAQNETFINAWDRYHDPSAPSKLNVQSVRAQTAKDTAPSLVRYSAIAFLAGLFVAICLLVIVDMARGPIHSSRDVEEDYELRLLGHLGSGEGKKASGSTNNYSRESMLANVRFASGENNSVCLIGIDPEDTRKGESASEASEQLSVKACATLANTAAAAHMNVLVIDSDMRGSSSLLAAIGGGEAAAEGPGLASVLAGDASIESVVEELPNGMKFMSSGANEVAVNPVSLLDTEALVNVLKDAQSKYDLVLINTTSPVDHADYAYVAHAAGSTVLVLQEMKSRRKKLEQVGEQLGIAAANITGFIMHK